MFGSDGVWEKSDSDFIAAFLELVHVRMKHGLDSHVVQLFQSFCEQHFFRVRGGFLQAKIPVII